MKTESTIQKHEIPLFLLLTYALSWWSVPLLNGKLIPHGPAIAAIIVLGITVGRQGLRKLWGRVIKWHIPLVWFIAGPAIILGCHVIGFTINLLLGAKMVGLPSISSSMFLELVFAGGWWEEPGWSGYLLPKMNERFTNHPNGLLVAALVTGVFRGIWHLPLFLYGHIPWFDIFIFNFAFQLIIAWVFYRSGGSVMAVMLLHFLSNIMGSFTYPAFADAMHTSYTALFMAAACLVALVLIYTSQFKPEKNADDVGVDGSERHHGV